MQAMWLRKLRIDARPCEVMHGSSVSRFMQAIGIGFKWQD